VLGYHGVGSVAQGSDPHGLFVSREQFEHQLDTIEGEGYRLLPVGELWQTMQRGSDTDRRGSISFDDGLTRTAREALPILLRRGLPCSMFIPTGLMGHPHPDLDGEPIVSASEVVELAAAGVEIGAHSVDHVPLDRMTYSDALDQLRRSRAVLEDLLGKPVRSMSYPYGAFNEQTIRAAREAGYELACGCSGPAPWRAFSLPREPIYPSVTKLRLRLKLAGLYEPVHTFKRLNRMHKT
jgi:peptidoglycan/xylan/chitin deacetylase (PgdA/CDA1 family)